MSKTALHSPSGRILYLDKNIEMRTMMDMVLHDRFLVVTAATAEEGLDILESEPPFDIVISGFHLSRMNGLEFLRRVSERYPRTVRVLMSGGCGDEVDISEAISAGYIRRFISKPYGVKMLREQLQNDFESARTGGSEDG